MPEPQTWNLERTGNGTPVTWHGRPIHYRINWQHFSDTQRLNIRQAIEDVAPRAACGNTNDGQTTRKPLNGKAVYDLNDGTNLYIYAKDFALINGAHPDSLAFVDKHNIGPDLKGAIMVFNTTQFGWVDFPAICHHEMGHVVGLEHPLDNDQMMGFDLQSLPWRQGDLDGFAAIRASN